MILDRVEQTIAQRGLAGPNTPVLLMVSGGSDSTALAYLACELRERSAIGELAILHVDHQLRGEDARADALFVQQLAEALDLPFFLVEVDVGAKARKDRSNIEALARHERYAAASKALESLCQRLARPTSEGRIFTAHTQDDRVESFYMRSIVGTGPGGFRSMRYANGAVARPCLDVSRQDLRAYIARRELDVKAGDAKPLVRDDAGKLWREDATNMHTDQFRGYVRHQIVPRAVERNPQLLATLCRTMNLVADEDDMLDAWAKRILEQRVTWLAVDDLLRGCLVDPAFATVELPLQRRVATEILRRMLGLDARIETASVEAICAAFEGGKPVSGYTNNIQGNLALSANKRGLLVEPMDSYRARRKGGE